MTNFIVNDLETHHTDRARPYCISFYRISKLAGRYNRDLLPYGIDKCKKDTIVFDGDNCASNALDFFLKLKREPRKTVNNKILAYNLQLRAHNASGSDSWIILNDLPCDKHIVGITKNGKGMISLRVFKGYIYNSKKQIPQYLIFRCGLTHHIFSLKKLEKTFKLQKELLKTGMNHDQVDGNNYKDKKDEWLPYVKNDVLCTAFSYARYSKAMEEITGYGMNGCLSLQGHKYGKFLTRLELKKMNLYTLTLTNT